MIFGKKSIVLVFFLGLICAFVPFGHARAESLSELQARIDELQKQIEQLLYLVNKKAPVAPQIIVDQAIVVKNNSNKCIEADGRGSFGSDICCEGLEKIIISQNCSDLISSGKDKLIECAAIPLSFTCKKVIKDGCIKENEYFKDDGFSCCSGLEKATETETWCSNIKDCTTNKKYICKKIIQKQCYGEGESYLIGHGVCCEGLTGEPVFCTGMVCGDMASLTRCRKP